ncbi:MAG: hypothetical protein KDK28_20600 [Maritimibacter sp.]|nr:hypothetical protein [Maritimibacter sp.]
MKLSPVSFASVALLVFAGWQAGVTLSRTPAFNRSLWVETARGDSIVGYAEAMYDRAEYYSFVAYGWLGRIQVAALQNDEAPTPDEAVEAFYGKAGELAVESLRHNPGDPGSWRLHAMAEAASGRSRSAIEAYLNWYAATPDSKLQAASRTIFLASFLTTEEGGEVALSMIDPEIVQGDLTLMRQLHPYGAAAVTLSNRPEFLAFGAALPDLPN